MAQRRGEQLLRAWKTIKVGTPNLRAHDDFCQALEQGGFRISDWARCYILPGLRAAEKETEIDLVVVSVAELGFDDHATLEEVYSRGREFGLELCDVEVGVQLRLQYKDQPAGETLMIAMHPGTELYGCCPGVLTLDGHDCLGHWISMSEDDNPIPSFGHDRWVFVHPRTTG